MTKDLFTYQRCWSPSDPSQAQVYEQNQADHYFDWCVTQVRKMSTGLALQANLWYNKDRKLVCLESAETLSKLAQLVGSCTMITLSPHTSNGNTPQKYCPKCETFKPATADFFHVDKTRPGGFAGWCKICRYTFNKVPSETNAATQRKYYAVHEGAHREHNARRRTQKMGNGGSHTREQLKEQHIRQKGKCYYCSAKLSRTYHVDHIVPLSRGGSNDIGNLVLACPTCNLKKGDRCPWEWPEGGRLL